MSESLEEEKWCYTTSEPIYKNKAYSVSTEKLKSFTCVQTPDSSFTGRQWTFLGSSLNIYFGSLLVIVGKEKQTGSFFVSVDVFIFLPVLYKRFCAILWTSTYISRVCVCVCVCACAHVHAWVCIVSFWQNVSVSQNNPWSLSMHCHWLGSRLYLWFTQYTYCRTAQCQP